ncbi:MAG: hypothetical protein OHK006_20750 [Thermodesulfovibrionales bacterium]
MNKVFVIEKSPDTFNSVKSYLAENELPYQVFGSANAALLAQEVPSLIVLFTLANYQEIRKDLSTLKGSPALVRVPKILILPFNAEEFEPDIEALDVQSCFRIPVDKLKFLSAVSLVTKRAPRRVFRILISILAEGSNLRYSGLSIDFSQTGMAFECASELAVGSRITVQFVNPRNRRRFNLKAEIVRRVAVPTGGASFYGVMFTDMTENDISEMIGFISGSN